MTKLNKRKTFNESRSSPTNLKEDVLANADIKNSRECGRVIDGGDSPAMGYSLGHFPKNQIRAPERFGPVKESYLGRCKREIASVLTWSGCQLTRLGLWIQGISETLKTLLFRLLKRNRKSRNDEVQSEQTLKSDDGSDSDEGQPDGSGVDEVDEDMILPQTAPSFVKTAGPFTFTRVSMSGGFTMLNDAHQTLCHGEQVKPTSELTGEFDDFDDDVDEVPHHPLLTPQTSFETFIEESWMDEAYVPGTYDERSYKTQFYMGEGVYLTTWNEVTEEMRCSQRNPFGEQFVLLCLLSEDMAHVVENLDYLDWFKSEYAPELVTIVTSFVYNKMPTVVDDVARWMSIAMALATGLSYSEREQLFVTDKIKVFLPGGDPETGCYTKFCKSNNYQDITEAPVETIGRLQCWKLLFNDFERWNDDIEEPSAITKDMLVNFIAEGAPLSDERFTISRFGEIFHVSRGGDMTANDVVKALPYWWSRLGYEEVGTGQVDPLENPMRTQVPEHPLDALFLEILNFIAYMLINVKQLVGDFKTELEHKRWFRYSRRMVKATWATQKIAARAAIWFMFFALNLVEKSISNVFASRTATRIKMFIVLNAVYTIGILVQTAMRVNYIEVISLAGLMALVVCILVPLVPTVLVIGAALSLTLTFTIFDVPTLWQRTKDVLIVAIRTIALALIDGPLKPVVKFIVNARLTVWILTETSDRSEVMTTFWVGDRLVTVTDRYNAPDDTDELAFALIACCWGSWGVAVVASLLMLMGATISIMLLKSILVFPLRALTATMKILKFCFVSFVIILMLPNVSVDIATYAMLYTKEFSKAMTHDIGSTIYTLFYNLQQRINDVVNHNPYWTPRQVFGMNTHMTLPEVKFALFRTKTIGVLRHNIIRFAIAFENVDLPRLMKDQYTKPSKETLAESLQILKELGWPVNVEVSDDTRPQTSVFRDFEDWFMANTNFIQPLRNIRTVMPIESRIFQVFNPPIFKHTGEYTTERLEVESTSRYFKNNVTEGEMAVEDDVWELLHMHFENSMLAKTSRVVNKLVKKYSVGFGFMDTKRGKTMSRKTLLALVNGEKGLVELFDKTLANIGRIVPVAHVFTKFETLKESKWMNNLVRTIIGVPLAHYSNTSKFSYMQNLRHPFEDSPIKVGMPLTGAWFADIWNDHAKRKHHFNGDLKLADSSYSREVFDVVKACRKKGFAKHRDFDKICTLIDIAYDQLMTMPLAFKSNGVVTFKGDGGATGQGNTSVDNSVALVTLYMSAWKRITGKSAKEFQLYNTLSNQADDHILSWDENPYGWKPEAWMKEFKKMGVTLTDESSSDLLEDASFLAKRIVIDHQTEAAVLKRLNISVPRFMTCHDKNRLLGKIYAPQPLKDHQARAKRLLSYMYLTAHHKDVYYSIRNAIRVIQSHTRKDLGVKIPSYEVIMRAWYTKHPRTNVVKGIGYADEEENDQMTEALDQFGELRDTVHIHEPTSIEVVLICLSMLPQIFSPRFMTSPALRHIHKMLGERVSWPIELLRRRNGQMHTPGAIANALMKTNYDFINGVDMEGIGSRRSDLSLMVSHWAFTFLQWSIVGGNGPQGLNKLLRSIDTLLANFYFISFGQVCDVVEAVGFGYVDTMLLVICNEVPDILPHTRLPGIPQIIPSDYLTRLLTRMWRSVQPSAAIDFEPIECMMNKHDFIGSKVIIEAPTGVGKSTRMISKIAALSHKRRIIVIEPRHILVTGLCEYMNKVDPTTGYGASTTGRIPSKNDRVIYCTYQSMVLRGFGTDADIVVVDEAHIKDPVYQFAVRDMLSRKCTTLLVTATPDPKWNDLEVDYIKIDTAPIWRIVENTEYVSSMQAYKDQVVKMVRALGPTDKALIFMPTTRQCAELLKLLPGHGCIISSKHPLVDETARFFVSTRVSDAGLTLPDVAFVFTLDIEWGVSTQVFEDNLWSPTPMTGHYRLDELTLKQRRGRTGRTCDGTFFLFKITGDYPPRQTTELDLLTELSHLLDLPHIESLLPPNAAELWDKYKQESINVGGGDITPQSLFPDPSHYKNPSRFRRANTELSAVHGQNGTNPIVSFDPLKGKNIFPGRRFEDRSNQLDIEFAEGLEFWGLDYSNTPGADIDRARELQVIPNVGENDEDFIYFAPYNDQIPDEDSSGDEFLSASEGEED